MLLPRRILVTGASSGIGRRLVPLLARPGRELALVARSEQKLKEACDAVSSFGGAAFPVSADLADPEAPTRIARELAERGFAPDALVLNAGASRDALLRQASLEEIERELRLNYLSPLGLIRELALTPKGADKRANVIVATASLTAVTAFPGNATYAASKAALVAALRSLAVEEPQLRVHVLLPGLVQTELSDSLLHKTPLGMLLPQSSPDEIARHLRRLVDYGGGTAEIPGLRNGLLAGFSALFPAVSDALSLLTAEFLVPGFAEARKTGNPPPISPKHPHSGLDEAASSAHNS